LLVGIPTAAAWQVFGAIISCFLSSGMFGCVSECMFGYMFTSICPSIVAV
jgi:hypothetical protein